MLFFKVSLLVIYGRIQDSNGEHILCRLYLSCKRVYRSIQLSSFVVIHRLWPYTVMNDRSG